MMSNLKTVLKALALVLLLGTGLWLMDQIAQSSMAGKSRGVTARVGSDSAATNPGQPQVTPAGKPGPSREVGTEGTDTGAAQALSSAPASAGDNPQPTAVAQAAGQSGTSAIEPPAPQSAAPLVQGSAKPEAQVSPLTISRRPDGQYIATEPILFSSASSLIRPVSIEPLKVVAAFLKERSEIKLIIVGYTDNLGLPENNQRVSAGRAAAVRDFLVSEGVDPSRLEAQGMGSSNPIASNDTQLGRQANRRIEFIIANPR